jgi:hypothetical protein
METVLFNLAEQLTGMSPRDIMEGPGDAFLATIMEEIRG